MARADEALGRLHEAHRAAQVHAARGDRDVLVVLVGLVGVDLRVALADVGRRLAGLPDAGDDRDDLGHVGGDRELVERADGLPALLGLLEHRAQGEAERRQQEGRGGHGAGDVRRARHEPPPRHRLALEGARDPAVGGVLALGLSAVVGHLRRGEPYRPISLRTGDLARCRLEGAARRQDRRPARRPSRRRQRVRRAPADRGHAGLPDGVGQLRALLGARLGAQRDDVGQLADRLDVAQLRQPREAQRVEPVARQQREIGLDRAEQARRRRSAAARPRGWPRSRRRRPPRGRASAGRPRRRRPSAPSSVGAGPRASASRPPSASRAPCTAASAAQNASRKAAAAASTVRSTCSASCASDGNHASYCDGGA